MTNLVWLFVSHTLFNSVVKGQNCTYDDIDEGCILEVDNFQERAMGRNMKAMGSNVTIYKSNDFPYIVSLQKRISQIEDTKADCFKHFCGATMIAPNLALTAAHCIYNNQSQTNIININKPQEVFNGSRKYYKPSTPIWYAAISPQCRHLENPKYRRMLIDDIYIHPQYKEVNNVPINDIAIVQLVGESTYDGPFVELPNVKFNVSSVQHAETIGYGQAQPLSSYSERYIVYPLHGGDLELMSKDLCSKYLLDVDKNYSTTSAAQLNYTTMICFQNLEVDTCQGDSGGPLIGKGMQIGIVSWGPANQCSSNNAQQAPGIFVNIVPFVDWIQQIVTDFRCGSNAQCKDFSQAPIIETMRETLDMDYAELQLPTTLKPVNQDSDKDCTLAVQFLPELNNLTIGVDIVEPFQYSLKPVYATLDGTTAITIEGVACPDNLELINETMIKANKMYLDSEVFPPIKVFPNEVKVDILGFAKIEVYGIEIKLLSKQIDYYVDGKLSLHNLIIYFAKGTTNSSLEGKMRSMSNTQSHVDLVEGYLSGSTLIFQNLNTTISKKTHRRGISIALEALFTTEFAAQIRRIP